MAMARVLSRFEALGVIYQIAFVAKRGPDSLNAFHGIWNLIVWPPWLLW
jgi:hypothetical protein